MGIVAWLASLRASESTKCMFQSFWLQPCMLQRLRASGATTWPGFKQGPSCGLPQRQRGYQQGLLPHGPSFGTHGAGEACGLADCLLISASAMPAAWPTSPNHVIGSLIQRTCKLSVGAAATTTPRTSSSTRPGCSMAAWLNGMAHAEVNDNDSVPQSDSHPIGCPSVGSVVPLPPPNTA